MPPSTGIHGVHDGTARGRTPREHSNPAHVGNEAVGGQTSCQPDRNGLRMRPDLGLRRVELALEGSGMDWTHLRPNFFMQIFCAGPHFAQISRLRQIRLPAGDAAISFIDARDVAAVAAKCMSSQATTHRPTH